MRDLEVKFLGGYGHWVGALQHIQEKSRPDLSYSVMRLSGYLSNPSMPCFQVLHQTLCYLYHHPHVPLMYPRDLGNKSADCFHTHVKAGRAELREPDSFKGLVQSSDADLARDLNGRRSTSCVVLEFNGVVFYWGCNKQPSVAPSTNASEIHAMFKGSKRTIQARRFFQSIGSPIAHPTPIFSDSQTTITQVFKDRLTPQVRHLDVMVCWLSEHKTLDAIMPKYINTTKMKADINTKPFGGENLQQKFLDLIGFKYYPPISSEHFKLLQLEKYNIGVHRGSFRRDI